ncbi:MAG: OmpH family outer membrane protein [Spirochaetia bacterium]|nr:OmpH family outer membrane protein [Spirochaetia bacterium]MBQ3648361.1 OmpH family outer membrane protein [Spirochaetia bacterium]MBQ3713169.1 OmpH family outer membrane protein [Spirochaetia bacterium]MBQ6673733.1 OmpH family outer membrane protein [Spirochaetia bacterium]MBQ6905139.1 OmpH family outer membrane protein [Spirochaetia bacterium]
MKKAFLFTLLFCASFVAYAQQQIPKIGIIDYSRIVQRMMPSLDQLQEVKNIKQAIDDETAAIETEIAALEKEKEDVASKSHYSDAADEIDEQITSLKYYLQQYLEEKNKELEEKKALVPDTAEIISKIVNQIQYVAESEGYSIIFDSKDKNIIWWTHSVDITDMVMRKLRL